MMISFLVTKMKFLLYYAPYCVIKVLIFMFIMWSTYRSDSAKEILQTNYDYIIVGAGTAGTIIFSEMPADASVLLVEAGMEPSLSILDIPIIAPTLQKTAFDWSYLTEQQSHACRGMKGRRCRLAGGRGYGGSNILNNLIYHRGSKNDFQGWFKDPSKYNYEKDILPLFREIENDLSPTELKYRTRVGEIFSHLRGLTPNVTFSSPKVLQKHGYRWTMAHLARSTRRSGHHEVVMGAQAIKLLFKKSIKNHVDGIQIIQNNEIYKLKAKKGYIITSGAIESPKLLMLSGIGPCEELAKYFIPCIVNLPGVGKNLQDHFATGLDLITLNSSAGMNLKNMWNPQELFSFFFHDGKSLLSTIGCEALGFSNSPTDSEGKHSLGFMVLPMGISTDAGVVLRNNLNIDDRIWDSYFRHLQGKEIISVISIALQPKSRGYISLASSDFRKPPVINPQYLSHRDDIATLVQGINIIKDILKNSQLRSLDAKITDLPLSTCETLKFNTPSYWECYVKYMSFSVYHLGGTCRIGDAKETDTVVDQNTFLVKGTDNLYVADASIMPNLPSGNSNAAVALIAKYFIKTISKSRTHVETRNSISTQADSTLEEHSKNKANTDSSKERKTEL